MTTRSAPVNEGDWICSDKDCGNINFTWRARCNRCGKEKGKVDVFKKTGAEIGKSAAAKSGGLFSAEDWQCSKCGNVNWARRSTCNICNEPKFGKVEARTGFGGGYNERDEIIEYKERDDSDGELDEFGRKKKKLRKLQPKCLQDSKDSDKNQEVIHDYHGNTKTSHAQSEEEDSGSDEDISKYDLLGDDSSEESDYGDEERKSSHSKEHHKHRSRSPDTRHRSRSPR